MRAAHGLALLAAIAGIAAGAARGGDDDVRLPVTDAHWGPVKDYVEAVPQPDYRHAPAAAVESFQDMKYGVRIHWGLYSAAFSGGESWPFLDLTYEEKQRYQEAYRTWNPTGFDADEWTRLFAENGLKMLAFTSKHHDGFSMFDTRTSGPTASRPSRPGARRSTRTSTGARPSPSGPSSSSSSHPSRRRRSRTG
jgi:alpha-L-fucosidase